MPVAVAREVPVYVPPRQRRTSPGIGLEATNFPTVDHGLRIDPSPVLSSPVAEM